MTTIKIYVKKEDSNVWHWAANCTQVPHKIAQTFESTTRTASGNFARPRSGELCNQCLSKERHGRLTPFGPEILVEQENGDDADN